MPMNFASAKVEVFHIESASHLGKHLQVFLLAFFFFFGSKKNGSDSEVCALM